MPFKSSAQKTKLAQLVKEGKMSQMTFDEWLKNSPDKLPERLHTPERAKVKTTKLTKVIK